MGGPRRLDRHPLTDIPRGEPVTFHWEGRTVQGHVGESLAASLYASGRRILSRSMRYHRARGYYCGTGTCTHCLARVDGQPNVRTCQTPTSATAWAEGQNAYPNVRRDVLELADVAYPGYLDAHTAFARPGLLRRLYLPIVRRMAGFGRVPAEPRRLTILRERASTDVLVVGGGPAGLAAAEAAAAGGARVLLLESEAEVGGRLRHQPTPFLHSSQRDAPTTEGKTWARDALARLKRMGVDVRTGTRAFACYDGTWAAASNVRQLQIQPGRVVIATGATDAYPLVAGADRAGVLLVGAAQRLLNLHGITPATPVVIHGAHRDGLLLARDLTACSVPVTVTDERSRLSAKFPLVDDVRRLGVDVQWDHRPAYVAGRAGPKAVVYETPAGRRRVKASTVVFDVGRVPAIQLVQQAGGALTHNGTSWIAQGPKEGATTASPVFAAGSVAGAPDAWASVLAGRRAGQAASVKTSAAEVRA